MMSVDDVKLISLPAIGDSRGNLSFFESSSQIPFDIERCYWIYDVPGGEVRGGHAYHNLQEVIIALSGSFTLSVSDGVKEKKFFLNRSFNAIFVPQLLWRRLEDFSTNSLALIAASEEYNEKDYIRQWDNFIELKKS